MQIMSKQQVMSSAAKAFKDNTITMTAETHPKEFQVYLTIMKSQGQFWNAFWEGEQK